MYFLYSVVKMRAVASSFCILAFLVTLSKSSPESDEERTNAIFMKCKNETRSDESKTDAHTRKSEPPMSPKAHCMMGCVMRESGIIVNGKFDREGSLKVAEKYYAAKKDEMEKAKTVIDICEKRVANETEECNLGNKVAACLTEESEKIGLTPVPPG